MENMPKHTDQITWQVTQVTVKNYGSHKDAFLSVEISVTLPNGLKSANPEPLAVLHDIKGVYRGEKGDVKVDDNSHHLLQFSNHTGSVAVYGFRANEWESM